MEAYGEGFEMLQASEYAATLKMDEVAGLWNRGSVVRSWLLELLQSAFKENSSLENIEAYVPDSGEGRWTVQQAVELGVPVPAIAVSLFKRFRSRQDNSYSERILSALRHQFGGHEVKEKR